METLGRVLTAPSRISGRLVLLMIKLPHFFKTTQRVYSRSINNGIIGLAIVLLEDGLPNHFRVWSRVSSPGL